MPEPFDDEPVYLTELPDELRARRAMAARRRRWRRRLALAALLAVIGAAAALVATGVGGGTSSNPAGTEASQPATQAQGTGPGSYPAGWEPHTGPVPILEYHAIQPPVAGSSYPQLFVPQDDFQHQMQWLADHGFEAVTLDQVEDAWYEAGELPAKPVVVTFDDGYLSQFVAAFPMMQKLGWPGVLDLKAEGSDLPHSPLHDSRGEPPPAAVDHRDARGAHQRDRQAVRDEDEGREARCPCGLPVHLGQRWTWIGVRARRRGRLMTGDLCAVHLAADQHATRVQHERPREPVPVLPHSSDLIPRQDGEVQARVRILADAARAGAERRPSARQLRLEPPDSGFPAPAQSDYAAPADWSLETKPSSPSSSSISMRLRM